MSDSAIASPLALLLQESEAREVLLLSFTLDLSFFERVALGAARALGALVTVVGDARYVTADPRAVRGAGRTYLDGRALCSSGSAFHPKLVVAVGKDNAIAAIGSGNTTLAGWGDNAEIWTIIRANQEGRPATFDALSAWLRDLALFISLSPGVPEALVRVADSIDRVQGPSLEGPRLLHNLYAPMIDQIPRGPVEELAVCTPFFDGEASALRRLSEQLEPRKLRIAVQPNATSMHGAAINEVLEKYQGEALIIENKRYHHGKLYEWTADGQRYGLTGSPNASAAALLKSMADGGNCELGILGTIAESIFPTTSERMERSALSAVTLRPWSEPSPALIILGVQRVESGIRLHLAAPLKEDAAIEAAETIDVWLRRADLPKGTQEITLPYDLSPGTAVRIAVGERVSNTVFVTDPARVLRRLTEHVGRVRTDESGVFQDARTAEAFLHDLLELKAYLPTRGSSPTAGSLTSTGSTDSLEFQSWEEYLDFLETRVGPSLTRFGLGLPAMPDAEVDWSGDTEEENEDDDSAEDRRVRDSLPDFGDRGEREQRRYRAWCEKLAKAMPSLAPVGRVIALRLVLRAVAGRLWTSSAEWVPLVSRAITAASADEPSTEQERVSLAGALALAVSIVHAHVRHHASQGPLEVAYLHAVEGARELLAFAEPRVFEDFGAELRPHLGPCASVSGVTETLERILRPDPIEEALLALADQNVTAESANNVIKVERPVADPRKMALRAVALTNHPGPVAAVCPGKDGGWAVIVWKSPRMLVARKWPKNLHGVVYELATMSSLLSFATSADWGLSQFEVLSWDGWLVPPDAEALLDLTGLSLEELGSL